MAGIRYKGQIFSGAASFGDADHVAYDNTQSGLSATNVQGAVDELEAAVDDAKPVVTWDQFNLPSSVTVGVDSSTFLLQNADISGLLHIPPGKHLMQAVPLWANGGGLVFTDILVYSETNVNVKAYNFTPAPITVSSIRLLCIYQ